MVKMKCNQIQCKKCIEKCRVHFISFIRSWVRFEKAANMLKLFVIDVKRYTIVRYYFVTQRCVFGCAHVNLNICVCIQHFYVFLIVSKKGVYVVYIKQDGIKL